MNLALHGFLLQVILSILDLQHGFRLCSAGEPGYLDFDNLPETNFSCQGKVIGGYYADVEAGCQMFHVCTIGQKDEIMDIKFLCLNGTVFDQETRVCERVDEVDCSKSERFYNLNLELYGNNAVTLSLHESEAEGEEVAESDDQQTTSARPSSTTTTPRTISSTTAASGPFQHPSGYPQHYQPQPPFPSIQTSQSKSHYDDKNGGYHRQYIYHIPEQNDPAHATSNDRATSFQLFSSQGGASSTTGAPQVHQIHYSSTPSPASVSTIFHGTSTIQTLLGGVINPIFHNIASTTDFPHSQTPRETPEYDDDDQRHYLEPIQSTSQGKISKLTISPVPTDERKSQKDSGNFLNIPPSGETSVKSFYPTPKASSKSQGSSHVTQHIHILPPYAIPQLKPHQVTINLPPPDIQRIVQNPSPLLPSQSRVIITAKASVSDESGRPLNTTQLVTLPQPTVPTSYDEYKEGDESFDPFYRDVPKIRNARALPQASGARRKRSLSDLEGDEPSDDGEGAGDMTQGSDEAEESTSVVSREEIDSSEVMETSVEDEEVPLGDEEPEKEVGTTQEPPDDAEISGEHEENISAGDSQAKSEEFSDDYDEYINSNEYFEVADAPTLKNDSQIVGVTEVTPGNAVTQETNHTAQINLPTTPETATVSTGNSSGVLIFTDEIPTSESQETMENIEDKPVEDPLPLDYVDDNYEPNNYQAQEHLEAIDDKKSKSEFMNYQMPSDGGNVSNSIPEVVLTTVAPDTTTVLILTSTETSTMTPVTVLTSETPSETSVATLVTSGTSSTTPATTSTEVLTSTMPETTLPTVETTTETDIESTTGAIITEVPTTVMETTLEFTTTTTKPPTKRRRPSKPTLANIIRAFSTKKSYIYIPLTTTPVPVVIKSRRPLKINRVKTRKFYNDSPPKPVIKRRQFAQRKSTSTEDSLPKIPEDFRTQRTAEMVETTVGLREIEGTTLPSVETFIEKMPKEVEAVTETVVSLNASSSTTKKIPDVITVTPETIQTTTEVVDVVTSIDAAVLTSIRPVKRKSGLQKRGSAFNCLEVELYRFYGDKRDCRLFHYCSPGFTSRQILDFRFVCEEGTIFDEDSQNCVHQVDNPKCKSRNW